MMEHGQAVEATRVDHLLLRAMDDVGLIGAQLRDELTRDIKSKILLRKASDAVEVVGVPGSGRHLVIDAAHRAAVQALGRADKVVHFRSADSDALEQRLLAARADAEGGTLVIEGFSDLSEGDRLNVTRLLRSPGADALTFAVSDARPAEPARDDRPATAIHIKPLHEREADIWELVDHFFEGLREEIALEGCLGFSRQARTDLAEVIRETGLASVRRVRDIVRDIVFEAAANAELPLKFTSEHVRPYLEKTFGQTEGARLDHEVALIESQFGDTSLARDLSLLEQLAEIHGVSTEVLRAEVEVLSRVIDSIDDLPRSYRNIMGKAEDIQRAALWLLSGAHTQAEFRRFFGDEGFMRPTKSVAWAFYNRVFQRET